MEDKEHLNQVNVHVLNAILEAAQDRAVLASRDIHDESGMKLLAQGKPMTPGRLRLKFTYGKLVRESVVTLPTPGQALPSF